MSVKLNLKIWLYTWNIDFKRCWRTFAECWTCALGVTHIELYFHVLLQKNFDVTGPRKYSNSTDEKWKESLTYEIYPNGLQYLYISPKIYSPLGSLWKHIFNIKNSFLKTLCTKNIYVGRKIYTYDAKVWWNFITEWPTFELFPIPDFSSDFLMKPYHIQYIATLYWYFLV